MRTHRRGSRWVRRRGGAGGPVLLVLLLVGLHALVYQVSENERAALASRGWSPTTGQVTSTRVWQTPRGTYEPRVTYAFDAADGPWRSARYGFWENRTPSFEREEDARGWLQAQGYEPGSAVAVYQDPGRPHFAVLDRAYSVFDVLPAAVFAGIVLLVDIGLLAAWTRKGWRAIASPSETAQQPQEQPPGSPAVRVAQVTAQRRGKRRAARRDVERGVGREEPGSLRSHALMAAAVAIGVGMLVALNVLVVLVAGDTVAAWGRGSWARAEGHVVSTSVDAVGGTSGARPALMRFRPRVTYQFEALGRTWQGSAYGFSAGASLPALSTPAAAERYLVDHEYQPGRVVHVHFDPRNPGRAVLNREVHLAQFVLQSLGVMVVVLIDLVVVTAVVGLVGQRWRRQSGGVRS
jgi:hypothetical protein